MEFIVFWYLIGAAAANAQLIIKILILNQWNEGTKWTQKTKNKTNKRC